MVIEKNGTKLKAVFRKGWSNQERVDNWVNRVTRGHFENPSCRAAWKKALRAAASVRSGTQALDVGTGPGTIAQLWAENGCRTTGLDFSPTMLDAARRLAAGKSLPITFIEGDAEDPPFPAEAFEVISSRLMLFTLPHPGLAIRRWVNLLKPGGRMVLIGGDMSPADRKRLMKSAKRSGFKWRPDKRYRDALQQLPFRDHTAGTLSVVMEAAGLRKIRLAPVKVIVDAQRRSKDISMTPFILVGQKQP